MFGRLVEFDTVTSEGVAHRVGVVVKTEIHDTLGTVFTVITPYDNEVRLTRREIIKVHWKEGSNGE